MTGTLFVPLDTSARALGADQVATAMTAAAAHRGEAIRIVRNGSRGALWLEPMIEVATPAGRIAYGPVTARDVPALFDHGLLRGGAHPLRLGPVTEIAYLKRQERLTFKRVGEIDPLSLDDYLSANGFAGLKRAFELGPERTTAEVTQSGLRGRGGAAFPTGIKWNTARTAAAARKYVVCNADEGDSGTFSDRMLLEGDPFALIEGMLIAGYTIGAAKGFIYLRSEYPHTETVLRAALARAAERGYLGTNIFGTEFSFGIELRRGAGAYICGEETALLESIEGRRGQVRHKPPLPALQGLFGCPTVINNVMSLAAVPHILAHGAEHYRQFGMGRSRGTLPFQLAGNIKCGGLVEKAFGLTLRELLYDFGGGSASGRPIRAVQVGGPLGAYLSEAEFDTPLDYEAFAGISAMLGHGGIVAFDDRIDLSRMARFAMEFCAHESCGKCTPCRIGSIRGVEVIDRLIAGHGEAAALLHDLCDTMQQGSLCAMGGLTPMPVLSALERFPEDFGLQAREPAA